MGYLQVIEKHIDFFGFIEYINLQVSVFTDGHVRFPVPVHRRVCPVVEGLQKKS
jgi:hypothetical protein